MKFKDLKFVRFKSNSIDDPDGSMARLLFESIPPYLFAQIKDADYKVDKLYEFGPILLMSPLTFLYVLINKETNIIKGVLWCENNPITEKLNTLAFSIDKEYQSHNGDALNWVKVFLKKIQKENNLTGTLDVATSRPKAYEKAGWKRSKRILLEI
ncbi:hypothetical protein LCGC14_1080790 [marine sediment metagenome]|uniref:N-acetyltransferase domain-containing protein n=1 Tax=marine sediment metagenome TaxID=412755 RepID=A0A0F9N2W4_9ZZZZ